MKRRGLIAVVLISLLLPLAVHAQATPPTAETSNAGFPATVIATNLRLRRAPRLTSSFRALLQKGEQVTAVGRDSTGAWLLVIAPEGIGWVDRTWLLPTDKPYYLPLRLAFPPLARALTTRRSHCPQRPNTQSPPTTL